jgi:hypothetical protein
MYSFTTLQILQAIAYWPHEPFTLKELDFLLKHFLNKDLTLDNGSYEYGENDIESFILEILSELE